jgi:N-acetylmuramoyl-L-alanine amidase
VPQASGTVRRKTPRRRRLLGTAFVLIVIAAAALYFAPARTAGTLSGADPVDPSAFASGACEVLPATTGDNHRTVFLDAGHGGVDPGAVGTTSTGATVDEATETLPVELDTADLLRAQGYQVVVSRTSDTSVARLSPADLSGGILSLQGAHDDVAARAECADQSGSQLLVGIYFDSGASPDDAGSLTTYDADRPFASSNLRLADLLQRDVLSSLNAKGWGIPNDGVNPDSEEGSLVPDSSNSPLAAEAASYGHLLLLGPALAGYFSTPSTMPGSVIEPLFITDPYEANIATTAEGQAVMARGIDLAVEQYFAPMSAAQH